ncbi:MAG: tape measure protein [Lachnospiraceae bacterium]|nr:tape measure protein [Lachnospiraceae bacterium]
MSKAVDMNISKMGEMYQAMSASVNTTSFEVARNSISQVTIEMQEGVERAKSLTDRMKDLAKEYASMQTLTKVLNLSDQMNAAAARLDLMNDGLQTTQDLQNMIYQSAERSGGSYQATADAVAKLGITAGDAFNSSEEIIAFTEQLNKQFAIAGAEAMGVDAAMSQLTQVMSSGVLHGEEFNSILEQAPNIIQAIADYMGVTQGQLQDMAAEGQITAEIVKEAMFAAADETNAKFDQMPRTFSQMWTSFTNQALMAFQPLLQRMNEVANSAAFQGVVSVAAAAVVTIAGIVLGIFDLISAVGSFVADNWSIIEPIIWGIVAALIVYNAVMGIGWLTTMKDVIAKAAHAAQTAIQKVQTIALMVAQNGLNAAFAACPIAWLMIGMIAIIGLIYAAVAAVNKLTGSTYSATGIICGILSVAIALITNLFITIWNISVDVLGALWNAFASFANFFKNLFNDPVAAVVGLVVGMGDTILGVVEGALEALSWITLGIVDYADDIARIRGNMNTWFEENYGDRYTEYVEKVDPEFLKMETVDYDDAWYAGYSLGEGIENAIADFDPFGMDDSNIPSIGDYFDQSGYGAELTGDVDELVENTGAMRDAMEITEEDLKYLRDIAEQEAVNRFTTAEIVIEQTNHNNVSGKMDLDGVVNGLTDAVYEAVDMIVEGVHV